MREQDEQLLRRILEERRGFGHREHLELAWQFLEIYPIAGAERAMGDAIRHLAGLHGVPDRYHETITRSWVKLVALHREVDGSKSFDEFITRNPGLLDRHLLDRHYSRDLLASDGARRSWHPPDLVELPARA